jgi:hypothetical protein
MISNNLKITIMKTKTFNARSLVVKVLFSLFSLSLIGCADRQQIETVQSADDFESDELRGFSDFKNVAVPVFGEIHDVLIRTGGVTTRSESQLPAAFTEFMNELSSETLFLLQLNEIDTTEFVDENDPRLAIVGLALLEAEQAMKVSTRTSIGGCVLEAVGISALVEATKGKAVKFVAKAIAKAAAKVVSRAIPYVGAGLAVADFVLCMAE